MVDQTRFSRGLLTASITGNQHTCSYINAKWTTYNIKVASQWYIGPYCINLPNPCIHPSEYCSL